MRAAPAIAAAEPGAGFVAAGRYRVISELGRGGMGIVLLAEHIGIGRKVALKVLSAAWVLHDEARRRFVAEARATGRIGHPGVVEVIDAGELADGRPFLAMEYLEGSTLLAAVQRCGPFAIERARRIARELADALVAAHAVGIVHRDLKSDNVMLVGASEALRGAPAVERTKLLDFGIAAALRDQPSARMTMPGLVIGTPAYMPPEQGRGAPATPSFDVYALGAVLFEMLAGITPFDGDDPLAVIVAKTSTPAPSIATLRADLPPALVELVDACLAIEPGARPADMAEVRARLDALARPRTAPLRTRRRARLHRLTTAVTLVGALCWAAVTVAGTAPPPVAAPAPGASNDHSADTPPFFTVMPYQLETQKAAAAVAVADVTPPSPVHHARRTKPPAFRLDSRECERTRMRAIDAREAHDWVGVLRHARDQACWGPMIDRDRLRVKATLELERFAECVDLGAGSLDPQVRRSVDLCRRRLATR